MKKKSLVRLALLTGSVTMSVFNGGCAHADVGRAIDQGHQITVVESMPSAAEAQDSLPSGIRRDEKPPLTAPGAGDDPTAAKSLSKESGIQKSGTVPPAPALEDDELPESQVADEALELVGRAEAGSREGRFDESLAFLDAAYEAMLDIPSATPEQERQRDDLRTLIARRLVEIHALRRGALINLGRGIPRVRTGHVEREIRSFQTVERAFFENALINSAAYREAIARELRAAGLPEELSWLPLVESGFKPRALSPARALGLWQFIASTGYRYGLNRDRWIDERMDPSKSTRAAIAYLGDLHGMFGDWLTALAAYNCGENAVLRLIGAQQYSYLDQFWDLYEKLPQETARYVPRFLATLAIVEDPESYGFHLAPNRSDGESAAGIETVEITRPLRLADIDAAAGKPVGTLASLNPELRLDTTPDRPYALRVPAGTSDLVLARTATLSASGAALEPDRVQRIPQRVTMIVHYVRRGETLRRIVERYHSDLTAVVRLNHLRRPGLLYVGQRLKVPLPSQTGRIDGLAHSLQPANPTAHAARERTHHVQQGESLYGIAVRYGVTIQEIRQLNGLTGTQIVTGQVLRVPG